MAFFDDFRAAIDSYPADSVELNIVNFSEPGDHINEGESCTFFVEIVNGGQLNMRDVKLHLVGVQAWTRVRLNIFAPWSIAVVTGASYDVNAHSTATVGPFHMLAEEDTDGNNEDILSVHLSTYDANIQHLLDGHSGHSTGASDTYNRHIHG